MIAILITVGVCAVLAFMAHCSPQSEGPDTFLGWFGSFLLVCFWWLPLALWSYGV